MGLAVYAYRSLRFVEAATLASLKARGTHHPLIDDRGHVLLVVADEEFRPRMDGMQEGFYAVAEGASASFSVGSYSSYNRWRERLAELVGVTVKGVWEGREKAPAFGELLDFSDCEGSLATAVCRRLAGDFAAWEERASAFAAPRGMEGEDFLEVYRDLRRAFELAAKEGAVSFH